MKTLLQDRYPAPPDGSTVIEREAMSHADVRFAAPKFKNEAAEAFSRAYALEAWWRKRVVSNDTPSLR